jgi:hypothetical protein
MTVATEGNDAMLAEIRKGANLKKTDISERRPPKEKGAAMGGVSVAAILNRRNARENEGSSEEEAWE